LILTRTMLRKNGISVNLISAGGTGTYAVAGTTEGITEVQAGNYLLMDTSYAPHAQDFQPALSLLTTVISVTPGERLILNAGIKEISAERGMPSLKGCPGTTLKELHAEHGIVELGNDSEDVNVGDNIEMNVYYSDGTVNLHRRMWGVKNGKVEEVFAIG
jgi:D-serine deaminase-like pyridoxal phosphate-dependent protein